MRLTDIARLPSFALLGPGFSTAPWRLIEGLAPVADVHTRLFFAAYEATGTEALSMAGDDLALDTLTLDAPVVPLSPTLHAGNHRGAVNTIRASIAAGDVYQVNHTVRAHLPQVDGASLVATLCRRGVPRFLAWVRLPDGTEFVSASPEMFFAIAHGRIRVEPMKGTAPAGHAQELAVSTKDEAELAMITDLLRNDLTPLCVPRSVTVTHERRLIELPYAVQAVSDIEGVLLPGVHWREALETLHPGGSITGAPRRAAMAMIAALEATPRGPYCGALGYVGEGRTVASILIRTASRAAEGWVYGVGGGIVWDSDPDAELAEIHTKLGALG